MSEGLELDLREAVVATARRMNALGINRGNSGNVSARWRAASFDGYLITPTGMPYEEIGPEDVVAMSLDADAPVATGTWIVAGAQAAALRQPSSEWRVH